jgi:hypothetical protein
MPMCNNTLENEYKEAVKKKYELEKNGIYYNYLSLPTRAKLRDLCWEIFEGKKMHQDDLNVFNSLLELPFDLNKKNKFREQVNKFRPIETFFKGETDLNNIDAVNIAAILVDFQPRPFNKFRKKEEDNQGESIIKDDFLVRNFSDTIDVNIKENGTEKRDLDLLKGGKERSKRKILEKLIIKSKFTMMVIAIVFCLISMVIYFAFIKKHCMQWSEDHYEIVDCNSGLPNNLNVIIPLKDELLNFKKIQVCDTTTCFKSDGEAIVWYAKISNDKADFFNTHGRHPENNKPLRPVTDYIKKRYSEKSVSKK